MGSNTIGSLLINLSAHTARLEADMKSASSMMKSWERDAHSAISTVKGAFGALGISMSVGLALNEMIKEAKDAEQASSRLAVVLKNQGAAAGFTKDKLDEMAESMAAATQFNDESFRNAASEILKFGTIHGETFRRVLTLSADVAAMMGADVPEAASQLAKALADPETAAKLLKTAGVVLTEQQKDQIKAMGEAGDKAGQQELILGRLETAYRGMAEEMNTGLTQSSRSVTKSWNELMESMGKQGIVHDMTMTIQGLASILFDKLNPALAATNDSLQRSQGIIGGKKFNRNESDQQAAAVAELQAKIQAARDALYAKQKKQKEQAAKSAMEMAKTIDELENTALQKEFELLGDSAAQFKVYELAAKGASAADIKRAQAAADAIDAAIRGNELLAARIKLEQEQHDAAVARGEELKTAFEKQAAAGAENAKSPAELEQEKYDLLRNQEDAYAMSSEAAAAGHAQRLEQIKAEHEARMTTIASTTWISRANFEKLTMIQQATVAANVMQTMLAQAAQHHRAAFNMMKAAKLVEAAIAAKSSVMKAAEWGSQWGPVAAFAAGAAMAAYQAVNLAEIVSAQFAGASTGVAAAGGGVSSSAIPGQAANPNVIAATPQASAAVPAAPLREINITMKGTEVYTPQAIRDTLIPLLNDAIGDGVRLNVRMA